MKKNSINGTKRKPAEYLTADERENLKNAQISHEIQAISEMEQQHDGTTSDNLQTAIIRRKLALLDILLEERQLF